ncbi:sugar ABC transporter ATP-binding protein [Rhizobiales bacterium Sp-1]|uniref:Sugar ABC transporter ATP-binding protein n=1 Tax=Segnochrobactrum spirostomi TaxID=2608987 RepID=A0A6A7Y337_9HYPH|nr:sugar ABC transporter ATP-binding protein [Segnochrobactrum spirostomi]
MPRRPSMSPRNDEAADSSAPVLEMKSISKTFVAVRALRDVSLSVRRGEIHALMGENGAGKSTLMKILSGAYQADPGGEIRIDGKPVTIAGPLAAKALGIAVIYQELSLSPNLTVAENIYLGREPKRGALVDRAAMQAGCQEVLTRLGATFKPQTIVATLSIAERQLVEIARALHADARILVMDEPTTTLSSRETDRLFDLIRKLRAEGLAIIYISHRMAEIYELADRCSVLRDGAYVGTLSRDELSAESLVKMMVGRDLSGFYTKDHDAHPPTHSGREVLAVEHMSDGKRVHDCSFVLCEGEVLAIAGLVGSGRTELARLIFGADRRTSGTVRLAGQTISIQTPGDAIAAGIVYLTEDRKAQGLLLDMTVSENINLMIIGPDSHAGFLDLGKARQRARDAIRSLSIRVAHEKVTVGSLSGGNQQKVLLSRLLEIRPKVLILDEPTRGVDIGAKSEIYKIIDGLVKEGIGVIVISSELPEVVGLADRVLVMREGVIEGEVGAAAASRSRRKPS